MSSSKEEAVLMDYSFGDEGVLVTVIKGDENISLDMTARDISVLKETLDRCEQRLAAEQEALGADADWLSLIHI